MARELHFDVDEKIGSVSAILNRPRGAHTLYVLAHGAGAGMRHRFMEAISDELAALGVATFRFQFPYTEAGNRRPDRAPVLQATIRAALRAARRAAPKLPTIAGGKSMGGRMTSLAAAEEALPNVRGIAFLGFPLHKPGAPSVERAAHLSDVDVPMLFLQGTRDPLADLGRMRRVCKGLGRRATLHVVDGGDHSFQVLKRSGRTDAEAVAEIAETLAGWARRLKA